MINCFLQVVLGRAVRSNPLVDGDFFLQSAGLPSKKKVRTTGAHPLGVRDLRYVLSVAD